MVEKPLTIVVLPIQCVAKYIDFLPATLLSDVQSHKREIETIN